VSATSPTVGQVLGHYRLIEQIGAGGMGIVFRALDEQLQRDVAVKILPPGLLKEPTRRERFRREALAIGRLNHSNIAIAFNFGAENGIDYLVTEYISGVGLDEKIGGQPLPQKTVLEYGVQMVSGLQAAHRAGVIHRDLKPGNIRINEDGQLKILDFGLAKVMHSIDESAQTDTLENNISVSGTLPYMAPELLRAERVDARADIWAAGAVLYEMATGRRAFPDRNASLLIDAILHYDPVRPALINPQISLALENVILKALDRDPDRRYQSARELRVDLMRLLAGSEVDIESRPPSSSGFTRPVSDRYVVARKPWPWITAAIAAVLILAVAGVILWRKSSSSAGSPREASLASDIHSIAVLPFTDLSSNGETQRYFADGMTEELINDLSSISALRVISRNSSMQYKDTHVKLPEIARELNVDAVVEGTVQRVGDQVKISAALVDARQDRNLWGHSYEGDLRNVLSLQSEVAQAIASEVRVQLSPEESANLARRPAVNPEAYESYLQALYLLNNGARNDQHRALSEFKKAVEQDPTSALAWAGLADSYTLMAMYGEVAPRAVMPLAEAAAKKALQLDDTLAQAHAALGIIDWTYLWNSAAAGQEFARAVQLNPGYAVAHEWRGNYLSRTGNAEEAIQELQKAQQLDPLSPVIETNIGRVYYYARRYDKAIQILSQQAAAQPSFWMAPAALGATYLAQGKYDDAIRQLERSHNLMPEVLFSQGVLGDAYGRAGRTEAARNISAELHQLSRSRYVPAIYAGLVAIGLGDKEQAFKLLDQAFNERSEWMMDLKVEPELDPLRSDPRFQQLERRVDEAGNNPAASAK